MKKWAKWLAAAGIPALVILLTLQGGDEPNQYSGLTIRQKISLERNIAEIGAELKYSRTERSKTIKGINGAKEIRIYSSPIHYYDKDTGKYEEPDLSIKEISEDAKLDPKREHDKYVNLGNDAVTWFDGKAYDLKIIREDGAYLKHAALFDTSGVTIETELNLSSVKQNYIIRDDMTIKDFKWLIETNMLLRNSEDNSDLIFRNIGSNYAVRISKPIAWDDDGADVPVMSKIKGDTLIYDFPTINDFIYPITIDPMLDLIDSLTEVVSSRVAGAKTGGTYTQVRDTPDTWAPNTDRKVGQDFSGGEYIVYRIFLTFDLTAVTGTIDSTKLNLKHVTGPATDFDLRIAASSHIQPVGSGEEWFKAFPGWTASGTYGITSYATAVNTSTLGAGGTWTAIKFNSTGNSAAISAKGDTLNIILMSDEDRQSIEPTTSDLQTFDSAPAADKPFLSLFLAPAVPTTVAMVADDETKITITWIDGTGDETGFRIVQAVGGDYVDSVAANIETLQITGLGINTYHAWKVQVKGGVLDGQNSVADSTWTLAAVPGKVTVSYPSTSEIKIILDMNSNPAYTKVAIQDSISGKYVHLLGSGVDDTLRTAVDWNTYVQWGAADGCTLSVNPAALFRLRSKSRNTNQ